MRRRRGALTAWGIVLSLFVAAACGGSNDKPVRGGTLRVSVRDLGSLDPGVTTGRGALLAMAQLFDSLTAVDPSSGEAVPAAASKWTVSDDGLTWTFTLGAATYHDGTPVVAGDFKAAFDRITLKATNSDVAFQLEAVKGFQAAKIAGTAQNLEGVSAPNDTTLVIALDHPFRELPLFLAHPALGPLAKSMAANPGALATQPVGNGPFRMTVARTADTVVLARFDRHAGGTSYLDSLEIHIVPDADQGWRDYLAGRSDVAEVPSDALARSTGQAGKGGFTAFWAGLYYGANTKVDKYAKPEVRRAISLAIERKAIATKVYGGTKEAATGIIPRGVRGFHADACGDCTQDKEKARDLIKAAFGDAPPEMVIDHLDASPSREVATAVAGDLQAVGLRVALRAHNSADYLRLLQAGQQEIAELGWLSEVPSPDGFLAQQLRSGSANNHTGYADSGFDQLIDQARADADARTRLDDYDKAETKAFEAMPLIPIVFFRNHVAVAERVRDLLVDGAGLFDAASVWIRRA